MLDCKATSLKWLQITKPKKLLLFHPKPGWPLPPSSSSAVHCNVVWGEILVGCLQRLFHTPPSVPMGGFPQKQSNTPMISAAELGPRIVLWCLSATVVLPRPPSSADFYQSRDGAKRVFSREICSASGWRRWKQTKTPEAWFKQMPSDFSTQ